MEQIVKVITEKKRLLDGHMPLPPSLQKYYDVELTYTSNAIEGNTLTHREMAEVIEHGITASGKTVREHLEAVDHYQALLWVRELAATTGLIDQEKICELHKRIFSRSQPEIAGMYSKQTRRIIGSRAIFPNPFKIPALMGEFGEWLKTQVLTPKTAFDAHFRLAAIHPFTDGNGRTARLLMNLLLIRAGYPPVAIRPEDRRTYLDLLEAASLTGELSELHQFTFRRLDETLDDYLQVVQQSDYS